MRSAFDSLVGEEVVAVRLAGVNAGREAPGYGLPIDDPKECPKGPTGARFPEGAGRRPTRLAKARAD